MNLDLLTRLSEVSGVSGDEARVRRILADAVRPHVDRLHADSMGNLHAEKDPTAQGPGDFRVMLAAHMDEVGLMVSRIGGDGLLAFEAVGGVDARILASQAVRIGSQGVPGVIGLAPPHLLGDGAKSSSPEIKALRIDIGADSKDAAAALVKPGDGVCFDTQVLDLGPTLLGKAFDDRGGCAMLAELLEERYPFALHGVFTVQEEIGLRGARVAAHAIDPAAAFVLECGTTDDPPKERDDTPVMRLGHGPAITVVDRSMIADARLVRHLIETAEAERIPYQIRAPKGGGTDGGRIHLARAGVPTAVVSIPCRYLHSPASIIHKQDYDNAVALMRAALSRLTPEVLAR
jgi:endoglucanase